MDSSNSAEALRQNSAPIEIEPEEFRHLGYQMVDRIAQFLGSLSQRPVTTAESAKQLRAVLGIKPLPEQGTPASELLGDAAGLLFDHSLLNGHPRFWGYITSSAAPIGALGDLLAATINPNVGAWGLSPMASEIEGQTIRWLAELIGYPSTCGGLLVSGGNMANFVGFLAARKAKASWDIRAQGLMNNPQLLVYGSSETHTWLQKAADLFGLGLEAIRWIEVDEHLQMKVEELELQISKDKAQGYLPCMVVGAAGTVSTGAVDDLPAIAAVCRKHNLWFHVDGAYGAPAAALPEASLALKGLGEADSVAFDPHKWLYSPLEAGCTLVRDPNHLIEAFSFHPVYYNFLEPDEEHAINYYEYGPQNSRGFRALKVWLGLAQVGRQGYVQMIREDIALAKALFELCQRRLELEALTHSLSITTFRYVPSDLHGSAESSEGYLNQLNQAILGQLQKGGEVFVSNAVVGGKYALRACVVNFRTTLEDIEALCEIVIRTGRKLDMEMR